MRVGYSADEIMTRLRRDFMRISGRDLSLSREDRELLVRLVQRTALQVVARAVELNNERLAEQLKLD